MNKPILDEFQCLLLDLSNIIYLYPVSLVLMTPVSIVDSCSRSCTFQTNRTSQTECKEVQTDDLYFEHDWNNSLYSLNVYDINHDCFVLKKNC